MIIDRYDPVKLSDLIPKLRLEMEPELAGLDRLLDDDRLFQQVRADLARRYPNTLSRGRHSTPVEVVLRMLIVRRLYDWSYEQTEQFVSDSLVLREFCRLYWKPAPDDTTLIRWAALIEPKTLERLNDHVVTLARQLKVTRGRKLRTDGTVVETTIHHPSDSSLLNDGVRVLGRLIRRAKEAVSQGGQSFLEGGELFRDRRRSAKRLARQIGEAARRRGEYAEVMRQTAYRRLLKVVEASLRQTQVVRERLAARRNTVSQRLIGEIDRFVPLVKQVVAQTRRRVLEGEEVPAEEKLVSLFEPHTCIIRRGKVRQPTEFGRKVWLDEVDGGIISPSLKDRVLEGNPADASQAKPSLANHQRLFGQPPDLLAGDRGVHSRENELLARQMGVKRVVLPQAGAKTAERESYERQGWFRRGQCFRAGVEGRISVLKRRGYLGRCRDHGEQGFSRWVGWGVLTANLTTVRRAVAARC